MMTMCAFAWDKDKQNADTMETLSSECIGSMIRICGIESHLL